MATTQSRRRAQAKLARQNVQKKDGLPSKYQPSPAGKKAREAAAFIGPFHPEDRDWIIRMKLAGWWDNGQSLNPESRRFSDTAEATYRYADEILAPAIGSAAYLINIIPYAGGTGNRSFTLYCDRTSG